MSLQQAVSNARNKTDMHPRRYSADAKIGSFRS
jgi:hypothetical protein